MSTQDQLVQEAEASEPAETYRGADLLVDSMVAHDVEVVFGLPGLQLDPVFDALHERSEHIRVIHTRHEQAASYMADGYARATGKTGCCVVVPGPGLLNAASGLATAMATSSPVVGIVADIAATDRGRDRGVLHEIPNQFEVLRAVTKAAIDVPSAQSIGVSFATAVRQTRQSGTRPVGLQIPADYLHAEVAPTLLRYASDLNPEPAAPGSFGEALDLIRGAQRPLILVGGGAIADDAGALITELAHRLQAPVIMSRMGRGAVDDRDPLAFTSVMLSRLLPEADVVIAIGSKLLHSSAVLEEIDPARRPRIIQIDADPMAIGRGVPVTIGLITGAAAGVQSLLGGLGKVATNRDWTEHARRIGDALHAKLMQFTPQAELATAVRTALPDDGIVISGMTQLGYWCNVGFPVIRPRTFLSSGYQGTLGFEYATALGAKVGSPSTPVVCLAGDGGFMFNVAELATAAQHNIAAIAIVFNDGAFGNVRRIQQEQYGGRLIASDLHNPDFQMLASSFGVDGYHAKNPTELSLTLGRAIEADRPALIEVPVGAMRDVRILG